MFATAFLNSYASCHSQVIKNKAFGKREIKRLSSNVTVNELVDYLFLETRFFFFVLLVI